MSSNKLDLQLGSPDFLSPYWEHIDLGHYLNTPKLSYNACNFEELKTSIKELHTKINNFDITDKQIIITNGASQGLLATINQSPILIKASTPHYYKFKDLCQMTNHSFNTDWYNCRIVTLPNNPDNSLKEPEIHSKENIYDLSYYWPQYIPTGQCLEQRTDSLAIFSLAKATGHASTRIGWIICKDTFLAEKLQKDIDTSTGGVSVDSQYQANLIIKDQLHKLDKKKETVFDFGSSILQKRWKILHALNLPFELENDYGHFIWCSNSKLNDLVEGVPGSKFGVSDEYTRYNIGCSDEKFKEFTVIVNKYNNSNEQ